jgi:hypothetical protein
MKYLYFLALAILAACVNGNEEEETGARLLISKQILNKYLVEDMDIVVKVRKTVIFDVILTNSVAPEPEGSSSHSRESTTGPYPNPGASTPHTHTQPISRRSILIAASHLRHGFPMSYYLKQNY